MISSKKQYLLPSQIGRRHPSLTPGLHWLNLILISHQLPTSYSIGKAFLQIGNIFDSAYIQQIFIYIPMFEAYWSSADFAEVILHQIQRESRCSYLNCSNRFSCNQFLLSSHFRICPEWPSLFQVEEVEGKRGEKDRKSKKEREREN